jgi:hypothetical protein
MRMRGSVGVVVGVVLAAGVQSLYAQSLAAGVAGRSVPIETLIEQQSKARQSPYSKLFKVPEISKAMTASPKLDQIGWPNVVCGMKLIPIDPSIDSKIYVQPPRNGDTRYSIRAVPPPVCK